MMKQLTAADVHAMVSMPAAIEAVRHAFLGLGANELELPPRTVLGNGAFLSMSVHHRPTSTAVVKSISVDFGRRPVVNGALVWNSTESAHTVVADAGAVTSLRTGPVVGVATDLLARADAHRLVIVGVGGLAAVQLRAVRAARPIDRVTLVAAHASSVAAFQERLGKDFADLDVVVSNHLESDLGRADVVTYATPSAEPLFRAAALPPRVHVNAVWSYRLTMRELPDSLLAAAAVVVDQLEAVLEESGEIYHALGARVLAVTSLVELSEALTSRPRWVTAPSSSRSG